MASLKDIRNRIVSVKNTQQITKAMKMVAASKLRRAQIAIEEARPYSDKLNSIVSNLSDGVDEKSHPLLAQREKGKAVILLISSDKGLCGGLNSNLFKKVLRFKAEHAEEFDEISLVTLGKKSADFFKNKDLSVEKTARDLKEAAQKVEIVDMMNELVEQFTKGEINRVYIGYNRFQSVIAQEPTLKMVLPIEPPAKGEEDSNKAEFVFEPSPAEILSTLLNKYVVNQAYTGLLDNHASEHGSRMTAMDSATNNASDMISRLQLQYNRARQAAITTELTEIISGAESIN